jgi:hypothetical protein
LGFSSIIDCILGRRLLPTPARADAVAGAFQPNDLIDCLSSFISSGV